MYEYYGVDGTEFFSGFFLGEWYDKFNGTGAATELAFTVVRTQAVSYTHLTLPTKA